MIGDAIAWLAGDTREDAAPFAVAFLDPPYDEPHLVDRALDAIAGAGRGGLLAPDGVVVVKHSRLHPPPAQIRLLRSAREERFGETTLTFYRWSAPGTSEEVG